MQAYLRSYFYGHDSPSELQLYNSRIAAKANTLAQVGVRGHVAVETQTDWTADRPGLVGARTSWLAAAWSSSA